MSEAIRRRYLYLDNNRSIKTAIITDTPKEELDMDFAKRVCEAGDEALHDPKFFAIYKNEANRHHKSYLDHNRKRQEHKAKERAREMQEKKKNRGLKKVCRAIDAKSSKPLIAARRKQFGPK